LPDKVFAFSSLPIALPVGTANSPNGIRSDHIIFDDVARRDDIEPNADTASNDEVVLHLAVDRAEERTPIRLPLKVLF
jgi:hypothetical protein